MEFAKIMDKICIGIMDTEDSPMWTEKIQIHIAKNELIILYFLCNVEVDSMLTSLSQRIIVLISKTGYGYV